MIKESDLKIGDFYIEVEDKQIPVVNPLRKDVHDIVITSPLPCKIKVTGRLNEKQIVSNIGYITSMDIYFKEINHITYEVLSKITTK